MGMAGSSTPQPMGMVGTVMPQLPYGLSPFQAGQIPGSGGGGTNLPASPSQLAPHQLAFQHMHRQQQQQQQLQKFWEKQYEEIEQTVDFKNHSLPLARIKKIMKADEDVRMISAEAPIIFAKACEMFILELTLRSWNHTEENKRRTLQKNDIAAAITRTEIFDFLVDIVPREDLKEDPVIPDPMLAGGGSSSIPAPSDTFPYYYMPPPHPPLLTNMGPLDEQAMYAPQQTLPFSPQQQLWLQQQQQQQPQSPSNLWADPQTPDHET